MNEQHNIIEDEDEGTEYLVDAILGFKSAGKRLWVIGETSGI